MHEVNTSCVPTVAFTNLVNCLRSHEWAHVTAGTTAAKLSANDVYRRWEPLLHTSAANLQTQVSLRYTQAEDSVSRPLIAAHDPPLMQVKSFNVWYNAGSSWGGGLTTRSVYC